MTQQAPAPQGPFTLTEAARQRLDERIAQAGGNVDTIEGEIRQELAELDSMTMPDEGPNRTRMQGERAHLMHQLGYLTKVRAARSGQTQE